MNQDIAPDVLFAAGRANANNWLANNSARRRPVSAEVYRALRLSEMVNQHETEDNFPDLLTAWERGFDSVIAPAAAALPADTENAQRLLAELHHADHIIKVMLNAMSIQQKSKVQEQLEAVGVSGEGMTRQNERSAVIEAAQAENNPVSTSGQGSRILEIESRAGDAAGQAADIAILVQAIFEKLDELSGMPDPLAPSVAAANCFATCIARNAMLIGEAAADILNLVREGGAA